MTVVNKRTHTPTANDMYIGRGSILGNPYRIGRGFNRKEAIEAYKKYARKRIANDPEFRRAIAGTKDKTLVCFCKPLACHGDVIEQLERELSDEPYV